MKSATTFAATLSLALCTACAVAPAEAPKCPAIAAPSPAPTPAYTTAVAVAAVNPRPSYVRPVIPPLPIELTQAPANGAAAQKPVYYSAELVAALVESVPESDVFLAGGDTYFWHRDPRGRRQRVFYGHGDRRSEIAQHRTDAIRRVADTSKSKD